MKVVILAGGQGTRLGLETLPKPMVAIGGRPLLWHVMKGYAHHGFTDFVVCLGHQGHLIRDYFANYLLRNADVTIDLASGAMEVHGAVAEPWKVTLVDTGEQTQTGGRLKRIAHHVAADPYFCMTYGDGVGTVDVRAVAALAAARGTLATVTAVRPPGRFGALELDGDGVRAFAEKPSAGGGWINGGFFVLRPAVLDYIEGDGTVFEREPLERLAREGQLSAHRHEGFWQPVDTLRDKQLLDELWATGRAPWHVWS